MRCEAVCAHPDYKDKNTHSIDLSLDRVQDLPAPEPAHVTVDEDRYRLGVRVGAIVDKGEGLARVDARTTRDAERDGVRAKHPRGGEPRAREIGPVNRLEALGVGRRKALARGGVRGGGGLWRGVVMSVRA